MTGPYDDIIDLPHHVSKNRRHMSLGDRAAQFGAFAALTGYDSDIDEAARHTDGKIIMDEYEMAALDERLRIIQEHIDAQPPVTVTFFKPDNRKSGGAYVIASGNVRRIEDFERVVVMTDGSRIPIDDISALDGALFDGLV